MAVSEVTTTATIPSPNNPKAGGARATRSEDGAQLRSLIKKHACALEESCEKGSLRDTLLAASWHRRNMCLGIVSVVLGCAVAAFSRGQLLTDLLHLFKKLNIFGWTAAALSADIVSVLALLSATLTSILTFLAPSEKAGDYHHFSNKLRSLRDKVRSLIEIDCSRSGKDAALYDKFDRMVREKSIIDSSHPIVPKWAYRKTYKEMKEKLKQKRELQNEKNGRQFESSDVI